MNFEREEKSQKWRTNLTIREREIVMLIDKSHPEDQLESIANEWQTKVDENWKAIQSNLADTALEFYNDNWTDPDEGYPELSYKQFLSKVFLKTIEVQEDRETAQLLFDDSGLFRKHNVEIFWAAEGMDDATVRGI